MRNFQRITSVALLVILTYISQSGLAQKLPVIRATSKTVDVKDGQKIQKGIWNLSPEIKPDIYYALQPQKQKIITFYTNIDSISFNVKPDSVYNFIVLLNEKDSCFIRISSLVPKIPEYKKSVALNSDSLKQDFLIFWNDLQRENAGLYRYKTKEELQKLASNCISKLNHPTTYTEFYSLIRYFVSTIEDGHAAAQAPEEVMDHYQDSVKMFPLKLWFTNNKAYVVCSQSKELPIETQLLSIDSKSIGVIRQELFHYLPSDGSIQTKKNWSLNGSWFPLLYNFVYGDKESFRITFKTKTGRIESTTLTADYLKNIDCEVSKDIKQYLNDVKKYLQLRYQPNSVAILTIRTFDDGRLTATHEDFKAFLESSFKEIHDKKIKKLIIDLRGNGGGADKYGALLYAYLTNKPFKYFRSIQSNTRSISAKEDHELGIQTSMLNNFNGKVLFVINGLCFSTTADFCAIAKSNERGKFIGEETGGAYYGNNSGEDFRTTLPYTKINLIIPQLKYMNAVKNTGFKDRGIIPNYTIIPQITNLIQHQNVQMNLALKLTSQQ